MSRGFTQCPRSTRGRAVTQWETLLTLLVLAHQDFHNAIHQIIGGCVTGYILQSEILSLGSPDMRFEIVRNSGLYGYCPLSAGRGCVIGPKWSSNGKAFFFRKHSSAAAESYPRLLGPLCSMTARSTNAPNRIYLIPKDTELDVKWVTIRTVIPDITVRTHGGEVSRR